MFSLIIGILYQEDVSEYIHRARRTRLRRNIHHDKRSRNSSVFSSAELLDIPKALFQRQLDGCLGVVPPTFYQGVYFILERSPHGILIYGKLLPQVNKLVFFGAFPSFSSHCLYNQIACFTFEQSDKFCIQ